MTDQEIGGHTHLMSDDNRESSRITEGYPPSTNMRIIYL